MWPLPGFQGHWVCGLVRGCKLCLSNEVTTVTHYIYYRSHSLVDPVFDKGVYTKYLLLQSRTDFWSLLPDLREYLGRHKHQLRGSALQWHCYIGVLLHLTVPDSGLTTESTDLSTLAEQRTASGS